MTHDTAPAALALGPEFTVAQAAACRDALVDALCAGPVDLALDLSGVTDIDSAGVQLLLALRHSVGARGGALRLGQPSAEVCAALAALGLDPQLQDLPCRTGAPT